MKSLLLKSLVIITALPIQAAYVWTIDGTPDDTGTVSASGSVVNGQTVEYYRYSVTDLNNEILTGTFTEDGITVDFAVTLIEYNNDHLIEGTTPSANDESFALYQGGQLDLFTFLSRAPTDGDPSNLTRGFRFDFYDVGTRGTTNLQNTTGSYSLGSPLDSNAITRLAAVENYEMTWAGTDTGYAYDPSNQINETIAPGLSQFNVAPDIDDVLTSNYGLFSADTITSFELRRQDTLSGSGRTGVRSGVTIGGEDLFLPNGNNIPEPSSSILVALSGLTLLGRRKR